MALCVYYMSVFMSACLTVSSQNSRVHRVFVGVAKFRDLAHLGLRNGFCIHTGPFRHAPSKLLYYKSVYDGWYVVVSFNYRHWSAEDPAGKPMLEHKFSRKQTPCFTLCVKAHIRRYHNLLKPRQGTILMKLGHFIRWTREDSTQTNKHERMSVLPAALRQTKCCDKYYTYVGIDICLIYILYYIAIICYVINILVG